ncbi:TetR/AcrR family transcriptional regulator C-terminal domain-containing protein [Nonomuraea sp. NPDC059023]|uniref:TetR/AcrR family transcriptional regulator C-terminal domain-containing protein n=1 Tax=unclassified Nonomuraea TaxID=2593643 RepID=UPI0036AA5D2E
MDRYRQIMADIRRRVTEGELRPGDRVPSTRQVAEQWGVATATAAKALTALRQEGVVVTVPRAGTVVAEQAGSRPVRPAPAPSPPKPGRERVVGAAIAIADAKGFDAVSMRSVATALDLPTMSLYRHVRGKEDLAALMTDTAFGELEFPVPPPAGWRPRLELAARLQWRLYLRHPWLPRLVSLTHPQPMPNMFRYADWAMRAVHELGLDPEAGQMAWWTVANYVRGTATNLEQQAESERDTGLTSDQWFTSHMPIFQAGLPSGALPAQETPQDFDLTAFFEFGLQRVLDGIAVLVGRRGAGLRARNPARTLTR